MEHDSLVPLISADVHIWTLPLDPSSIEAELVKPLLDEEERSRLALLRSPLLARRFIMAHAGLRLLLSHYSGLPWEMVRYVRGLHGKPALASHPQCHFNLSHSHDLALVAVSQHPVGVDIEKIDKNLAFEAIGKRYFSSGEVAILSSLPVHARLESFYACWTRKEAYMKACGAGFSLPSHCFDMSLLTGEQPALLSHRLDTDEPRRWRISDVTVPNGFRGALATGSTTVGIREYSGIWGIPPLSPPTHDKLLIFTFLA